MPWAQQVRPPRVQRRGWCSARLRRGDRRAQHDVAEQALGRLVVVVGRAQLVHREARARRSGPARPSTARAAAHRVARRPARSTARPAGGSASGRARTGPAATSAGSSTSAPDSLAISTLTSVAPRGRRVAAVVARRGRAGSPRTGRTRRRCRPTSLCRTTSWLVSWQNCDVLDAVEDVLDDPQPAAGAAGQVDLGHVAGDHDLRAEAEPGQEHLHLLRRGVLRLVEDDERVVEGAAAHVRQRRDLDRAGRHQPRDRVRVEHVVQRVVERAQVGVDLLVQRAGQEAEPLPRLDRGPGQDDPADLLGLQRLHGLGHGQVGLAGAGRADAEHDGVLCRSRRRSASGSASWAGSCGRGWTGCSSVSTSAGRSARPGRSMRDDALDGLRRSSPWPVRITVTSSSIMRSASATSPVRPVRVISLPRTWMSASNSRSRMRRNSSRGPEYVHHVHRRGTVRRRSSSRPGSAESERGGRDF